MPFHCILPLQLILNSDYSAVGCRYEEFVAALTDWNELENTQVWQDAAKEAFHELDRNSKGTLDLKELADFLGEDERSLTVLEALHEVDVAQNGQISIDDFMTFVSPSEGDHLCEYDGRLEKTSSMASELLGKQASGQTGAMTPSKLLQHASQDLAGMLQKQGSQGMQLISNE